MDDLKNEITAFCHAHSLSGARFSELAVGDASFWHKLTRGRDPKYSTVIKVREFMRDYQA
jgi:predicted transcriptional regulator